MVTIIRNAKIVNEGKVFEADVLIRDKFIEKIGNNLSVQGAHQEVDAAGKYLIPGLIDDQVHFREPGLTHKGNIASESKAAVAGGITSYMEMPNTKPPVFTRQSLEEKYEIAARTSWANYSFYMGASNDNLEEISRIDLSRVCGLKIFMGSSTGNLLVDDQETLKNIFSRFEGLIATHCEDEQTIIANTVRYREKYGENVPIACHASIRSAEACYQSSSRAVELARQYQTRLHVLHISTARELSLFSNDIPLSQKHITAEACLHHLWFTDKDYERLGTHIKWNPAVKSKHDREALLQAVLDDRIDVLATDHAPHTQDEKDNTYFKAPSGGPLVQHQLVALLEYYLNGQMSIEKIVEKACHNPAILFRIDRRGYVREGCYADLVLVETNNPWKVAPANILAHCGWSPFEGVTFRSAVTKVWVSGHLAYDQGAFQYAQPDRLAFVHT